MLNAWKVRFEQNKNRHPGVAWETVEALLLQDDAKLRAAEQMENSGGEPDVIAFGGRLLLCDCAEESPRKRSSLCYDGAARLSRKKNAPASSAVEETEKMGVRLMTEEEYRYLQTLGAYDMKTSSWVQTPERIRSLGGAIFCERRYDTVTGISSAARSE